MPEINFTENTHPKTTGLGFTDYMYVGRCKDGEWYSADILPYGEYSLPVQTTGLRHGLTVYETVRVTQDKDGKLCIFRGDAHIAKLWDKADKKGLPLFEEEHVMYVLTELVKMGRGFVNADTVMFATIMLTATDTGSVAYPVTNACLTITLETLAKQEMTTIRATNELLELDKVYKRYAVSVGGHDLFFRIDDKIITSQGGGITKDSILKLITEWGISTETGYVSMDEAIKAYDNGRLAEVFCTDSRGVVMSVTALEYNGRVLELPVGKLSLKLYDSVTHAELGTFPDHPDWMVRV